jgi:hypothetical protein
MGFSGGVFVRVAFSGHNFIPVDELYTGYQLRLLISPA